MDIISFNEAATANGRIEKFIKDPDSNSGIVTVPKVIGAGESVTIPEGRVAVLPNVQVNGTLNVLGEVFIPSGSTYGDLDSQIATKATKQESNITVNVGAGGEYTTINQALEYLSGFYPLHKATGVTATINLKAGFIMNEQVLVRGLNLGWITIVGEDAETIITHTALTTAFYGSYPAFGVGKGGTSPVIGQLFRFNVEKVGGSKHGLMTVGAGSSADVLPSKGFIGAGAYGIFAADGSTINANSANCSNAGDVGIYAINASTINANSANCSNAGAYGIFANVSSTINAINAVIQNQTTGGVRVLINYGSVIAATGINTTGGTVPTFSQAVNTLASNGIIYG